VAKIRVRQTIDVPPGRVWDAVRDIESHVKWMDDAESIRFTSGTKSGLGTTYECDTKVGPFRVTDRMEVTEWLPGQVIGVRHTGLVTGAGRFTVQRSGPHQTRFTWEERLTFPMWMGGPVGARMAKPILRRVWRRNLRNLKGLIEH
jgi:carbon monoxide dehydrogenase subunit G